MATDFLSRYQDDLALTAPAPAGTPGKTSATSRLPGARTNIVMRVESPEAARELAGVLGGRDPNGVAAGADAAVDRASGSSGAALPEDLRARFEGSLGADLSGVRVHTGADSQSAARAVGARAYTLGQDIHFADGAYDPSSAFGVHLIAHEVAHTVQQAGGAPVRQHKLEVSTPGDAAEVEADRAADAMVRGAPAVATSAGSAVQRDKCHPGPDYNPNFCGRDSTSGNPDLSGGIATYEFQNRYTPIYWPGLVSPSGVGLADIPTPRSYVPIFEDALSGAPQAFRASAAAAVATHNSLIGPIKEFKQFAADAEAAEAAAGTKPSEDPGQALSNVRVSGAASSIADTFPSSRGFNVDADPKKLNAKTLDQSARVKIKAIRDKLETSVRDINTAQGKVSVANQSVESAAMNAEAKAAQFEIAINESADAELAAKKGQLQAAAAETKSALAVIKSGTKVVTGLVTKASFSAVAGDVIDLVDGGANAYYTGQINNIDRARADLTVKNAALATIPAYAEMFAAKVQVSAQIQALVDANNNYEDLKTRRTQLFTELAAEIEPALVANGATKKERDAATSAIDAVPLIEQVISRLDGILAAAAPPPYSDDSGLGYCFLRNRSEFLALLSDIAGYRDAAQCEKAIWSKRLEAARNLMKEVR